MGYAGQADVVNSRFEGNAATAGEGGAIAEIDHLGGALRVLSLGEQTTSLASSLSLEELPTPVYAMATTAAEHVAPLPDDEPVDLTGLED